MPSRTRLNRRQTLQLAASSVAAAGFGTASCTERPTLFTADMLGFNLVTWNDHALVDAMPWKRAVNDIHNIGANRVTFVPFALFNQDDATISNNSAYGLDSGPDGELLVDIIRNSKLAGMSVGLKPMIEIDNEQGEGVLWRGEISVTDDTRETFFEAYETYILGLLQQGCNVGIDRFYIGSELLGLVTDQKNIPYWHRLIARCRQQIGQRKCILSYAANFDEYASVPFWNELDEIGVDAYFRLAKKAEAEGEGRPDKKIIRRNMKKVMAKLEAFASQHGKRLMMAEWGVVPFEFTTVTPSNPTPSEQPDEQELLNAYEVLIEVAGIQGDWLSGIDLWHWQVSPEEQSNYQITRDSSVARLLTTNKLW